METLGRMTYRSMMMKKTLMGIDYASALWSLMKGKILYFQCHFYVNFEWLGSRCLKIYIRSHPLTFSKCFMVQTSMSR